MSQDYNASIINLLPPSLTGLSPYPHTERAVDQTVPEDGQPTREPLSEEDIRNILAQFAAASSRVNALRLQDATRWSAMSITLPAGVNSSVKIAGRDSMRKTIKVKNLGTQRLYVTPTEGVAASGTAFILDAAQSVDMAHTSEVFIGTDSSWVEGTVTMLQERYE